MMSDQKVRFYIVVHEHEDQLATEDVAKLHTLLLSYNEEGAMYGPVQQNRQRHRGTSYRSKSNDEYKTNLGLD